MAKALKTINKVSKKKKYNMISPKEVYSMKSKYFAYGSYGSKAMAQRNIDYGKQFGYDGKILDHKGKRAERYRYEVMLRKK